MQTTYSNHNKIISQDSNLNDSIMSFLKIKTLLNNLQIKEEMRHTNMANQFFEKGTKAKINGKRTDFSTNSIGTTGHLYVKKRSST